MPENITLTPEEHEQVKLQFALLLDDWIRMMTHMKQAADAVGIKLDVKIPARFVSNDQL